MNRAVLTGIAWLGICLGYAAGARAQAATQPTTQPDAPWALAVGQFANALTQGDQSAVVSVLADKAVIHTFIAKQTQGLDDLLSLSKGARLLGAHVYQQPPLSMAADMAVDFKHADDLPDKVRRRMIPQEDAQMQRANATAIQWVEGAFGLKSGNWEGASIGVIVLWSQAGGQPKLMFVMLRGQPDSSTGAFRMTAIAYGDPLVPTAK